MFIHRDFKLSNLLVDENYNVKVCDFGLSCVKERFDPKAPPKDKAVGTPVYMVPRCALAFNRVVRGVDAD